MTGQGPVRVRARRIYDPPAGDDGARVLVDRVWPRGMSRARAQIDDWFRDVAPSTELRRWYGHDQERFEEFRRRYRTELASGPAAAALRRVAERATHERLTLLTATKDLAGSHAAVLVELLAPDPPGTATAQIDPPRA